MITVYGKQALSNSDQIVRFGESTMAPLLRGSKQACVIAKNLQSATFERNADFQSITREPDDALVHDHDKHVLLIRSGETVPDNTLMCDYFAGIRALARAAIEIDIVNKMEQTPPHKVAYVNKLLNRIAAGFRSIIAGDKRNRLDWLCAGRSILRSQFFDGYKYLTGEIKCEIFRTLIAGHHLIPSELRTVIKWDEDQVDALLIGAGSGHARSLLETDYTQAKEFDLETALGATKDPAINRGLHYSQFAPKYRLERHA